MSHSAIASSDIEAQEGRLHPHITVGHGCRTVHNGDPTRDTWFRRTLSSNEMVDARARLPAEFRTLSIHAETKTSTDDGASSTGTIKDLLALDWHKISPDEVLQRLNVSPNMGLETVQAQRRLQANGRNVISGPKNKIFRKLFEWLLGGFGSLLFAASLLAFIAWKPLGEPEPQTSNLALAVVLLMVVAFQTALNAWQDFSTSKVVSSIKGMLPSDVLVFRDGSQVEIPAADLVTGDLVCIAMGEKVPADLRLTKVSGDLLFDRSILTGESEPTTGRVENTVDNFLQSKNIALQGTHCVGGSGVGVVIQTGDDTAFGRIAKLSSAESTGSTTLQREILHIVLIIASIAALVAIMLVVLWVSWLRRSFPSYINVSDLLVDIVSIMVGVMPVGLPIAVTLSLARIAHAMSKNKVLCKSLSMVETLGSVNVLCSDKTGTLTQNEMRVHNIAVFDKVFETSTFGEAITISPPSSAANLAQSTAVGVICNATTSGADEIISGRKREKIITGDATDVAILEFCGTVLSVNDIRNSWTEVFRLDFHSKNKFMLKLSKLSTTAPSEVPPLASWDQFATDDYLLSIKGAPEVLISRCKFVLDPNGGPPIPLSSSALERIVAIQEKWAQHGQRVLLLARRVIRANLIPKTFDPLSDDFARLIDRHNCELIIVALVGLIDPLKPSIKRTVSICRRAGIRFFVVTGDHPSTSVAIAAQAGIISNTNSVQRISDLDPTINPEAVPRYDPDSEEPKLKSIVITGPELDQLNDSQIEQLCQYQEVVFARTTPEQKLHIVCDLQKRRNIVAMTGDGVNDAPSLKAADCGIAMGKGSDVAREAADMVLLDDFSAIVVALKYGRLVHDNLKKTILYLLPAGSFSELMPMLLNMLIGVPQMLSNIQMILICVATDVLPALSLCLEDPEMGLLERKPRDVTRERLVDWRLLLHAYGFLGMAESLCAMSMSFWYLQRHGVPFSNLALGFGEWPGLDHELLLRAQSVYFFTLVLMQWGNLFATRSRKLSIFQHTPVSNWSVFPACGMALCIGIFFSYVPWFQGVFQTRPIAPEFFFIPITFGLSVIFLDESRKYFVRRYPSGFVAFLAW